MDKKQIVYMLLDEAKETGEKVMFPSGAVIVETIYYNPVASFVDENNDVPEMKEGSYGWALVINGVEEVQCSDDIEKVATRVLNLLGKEESNE